MNCIVKIPGDKDLAMPDNCKALLYALDMAVDNATYTIIYKGSDRYTIKPDDAAGDEFSTFVLFEFPDSYDDCDVLDRMKQQVSQACSLEVLDMSENYQLVTIDHWGFSFKRAV